MQKYRDLEKLYLMNSLGIQQLQNRAEMNFFLQISVPLLCYKATTS